MLILVECHTQNAFFFLSFFFSFFVSFHRLPPRCVRLIILSFRIFRIISARMGTCQAEICYGPILFKVKPHIKIGATNNLLERARYYDGAEKFKSIFLNPISSFFPQKAFHFTPSLEHCTPVIMNWISFLTYYYLTILI